MPRNLTAKDYIKRLLDTGSLSNPRLYEHDLRCVAELFSPEELAEIDQACPRDSNSDIEDARNSLKLDLLQFLSENDNKEKTKQANNENGAGTGSERKADQIVIDFLYGKQSYTLWQDILAAKMSHIKTPPWNNPRPDWSRSNRYNPTEFILPGSSDRVCDVLIGVDVSGSMERLLPYALLEVEKIIDEVGVSVKFFSVNTEVGDMVMVDSAQDIDLYGGGGTDMRKAYEFAATIDTGMFILLTDGETPYPISNPCSCDVLTALLHPFGNKPDKGCYPKFGEVLEIPVE